MAQQPFDTQASGTTVALALLLQVESPDPEGGDPSRGAPEEKDQKLEEAPVHGGAGDVERALGKDDQSSDETGDHGTGGGQNTANAAGALTYEAMSERMNRRRRVRGGEPKTATTGSGLVAS